MFLRALCPCQRNQSGAGNFEPGYTGDNEGSAGGPIGSTENRIEWKRQVSPGQSRRCELTGTQSVQRQSNDFLAAQVWF